MSTSDRSLSELIKNTALFYKKVTEQYQDADILDKVKLYIPERILELKEEAQIKSLLEWFKKEYMSWIPNAPMCERCIDEGRGDVPMQIQTTSGSSWKLSVLEIHSCNKCGFEKTFPRYNEVLKIAEARTGRCGEWSILFGAILSGIGIKSRIVHDFLDHVWNEAFLDEKWVHMDSSLAYPISVNHPYYYEQNWGKQYEYILAFSEYGGVEDVTQRYTQSWETVLQRRGNNALSFQERFSYIA